MSDFRQYLEERKRNDPVFAEEFEQHYESFKLNVIRMKEENEGCNQRDGSHK